MDFDKNLCLAYSDKIWAWIITFLSLCLLNRVIALDVCENSLFLLYLQFKCVTSRLGQLHLLFHKFLTGLFPFINVKKKYV